MRKVLSEAGAPGCPLFHPGAHRGDPAESRGNFSGAAFGARPEFQKLQVTRAPCVAQLTRDEQSA
jgi:hypothetical protein